MKYKLVLGLEVHMHLKTVKKMFCGCNADIYGADPNTHTCPVCLGLPGALPVPNFEAIKKTQLLGLALKCQLNTDSQFDRKHYFYPDLPKGYQISQYQQPLCIGTDDVLERIHLEEDTAKSFHENGKTLIDFNKSGMPLIEIVTKPAFSRVEDAVDFARKLRDIARFLGVSDADMEKGQMRIEPNISLRTEEMEKADKLPDYKVEVKNINSFRFMEKAVNYEIKRQKKALEEGKSLVQENRGYDERTNTTKSQRFKEEAHDYRYFPEPDIPPMHFDKSYFKTLEQEIPELPHQIKEKLMSEYKLPESSAEELTKGAGLDLLPQFEALAKVLNPEKVANLLINRREFRDLPPAEFKKKYAEMEDKLEDSDTLTAIVKEVIAENTGPVEQYKAGKETVLQFLVGQIMRKTKGKADPETTINLLKKYL